MTGQMKNKQKLTELVIKAQAGDQNALNDLIGACYEDLYFFAYQTVKDPDTASDIIQDSCISIITNLSKLQSPEAFSVWVRNITYNHCAMHFRKTKEVQPLETEDGESILDSLPDESEGSLPEQVVEDKEFQKTMQDMLDSLPGEQRSAMMLYYYEKLSVKQIAEVFETSEGTIKSRLNYGRKAMKGKVEEYEKKNGVRLHSSLLPLLLLWLFQKKKKSIPKAAVPILAGVSTAAAASAGVAATISGGLVIKIVAGVVAAVVAVSAVVGGVKLFDGKNDQDPTHLNGSTPTSNSTQTTEKQEGTVPTAPNQSDDDPSGDGENITPPVQEPDSPETPDVDNPSGDDDENVAPPVQEPDQGEDTTDTPDNNDPSGGGEDITPPVQEPDQGADTPETPDNNDPSGDGGENITPPVQDPDQGENNPETPDNNDPSGDGGENVTPPVQEPNQGEDPPTTPDIDDPNEDTEKYSEGLVFEKVDGGYAVAGIGTCTDEIVTIPATYMGEPVISIKESAFGGSKIKHVTVPEGVTNLFRAFNGCYELTSASLPEGVTNMFYTFSGCTALTDVNLPSTVTNISGAFSGCSSLTHFDVPVGIKSLYYAFSNCTSLRSVTIPDGVTDLFAAFQGCTSLESITIPEGVTTIASAFSDCKSLREITIPKSVVYASEAFANCTSLTEVTFEGKVNLYKTFRGCTSLTKITVPEGVNDLRNTFRDCAALAEVTVPVSVTEIEGGFVNCNALTNVYYSGTMAQWTALEEKGDCGAPRQYVVHCSDGDIIATSP